MSALSIQPTYPIFTDIDGQPLEAGYVWIGTANLDPQTNPINVYWDEALTILAPQPIRTLAGYPSRNGTPARLYVNSDYSIRVMNKNGSVVYSAPTATERYSDDLIAFTGFKGQAGTVADLADDDGSDWIGFNPSGAGAVARSAQDKMRETVSVKDFGAVGDGVADDTAAIQAALAASDSVYIPAGEYKVSSTITLNGGRYLKGESVESVTIKPTSSVTTVFLMEANSYIQLLYIDGSNTTNATGILVGQNNIANLQQITEVTIKNFAGASAKGINIRFAVGITLTSVITRFCTTGLYVLGNSGAFPTHITCYSCTFSQGTKGVHIIRVHVIRFYACLFETNMEEGVYVADGDIAEGLTFDGCWLENNWYGTPSSNYQMYLNGNTGGFTLKDVTVNDCYFYKGPDGGTPFAAKFSRVRNLTFSQNLMPDLVLGDVVFDNNTNGWISNQEFTTADGVLVDTTGFMNNDQSAWRTWTPAYIPQAGTFTSVTTSLSSYTINGNTITLNLTFSGTTSTTPTNITVTYPNIPSTIAPKVGGVLTVPAIISGEPTRAGRCLIHPSGLIFYPDAGWTAGAGRGASISVTFELADY